MYRLLSAVGAGVFVLASSALGFAAIPASISGPDVLTGNPVSTSLHSEGKAIVVVFLSARCPCSASHEVRLSELYSEFAPQGFRFVGVHSNADEPMSIAQQHFSQARLPFSVVQDPESRIADQLGALKTPHVFVVGPQGELLFQGGVDDSHVAQTAKKQYLREALLSIAQGKEPAQKEARSLGCVIKRP